LAPVFVIHKQIAGPFQQQHIMRWPPPPWPTTSTWPDGGALSADFPAALDRCLVPAVWSLAPALFLRCRQPSLITQRLAQRQRNRLLHRTGANGAAGSPLLVGVQLLRASVAVWRRALGHAVRLVRADWCGSRVFNRASAHCATFPTELFPPLTTRACSQ
jgi:hypothetical protein